MARSIATISIVRACTCLAIAVLCGNDPITAEVADEHYEKGKRHYADNDYRPAAEHLFAYLHLTEGTLPSEARRQIQQALSYCEEQLDLALRTKQQLDKHGKVVEVVVQTEGKMDDFTPPKRVSQPFQPPSPLTRAKPELQPLAPRQTEAAVPVATVKVDGVARAVVRQAGRSARATATSVPDVAQLRDRYAALTEEYVALTLENRRLKAALAEAESRLRVK